MVAAEASVSFNRDIMKSVRKVLGLAIIDSACIAEDLTGKSINSLPEFFLAVKVAEYLHSHFETFTFSLEESLSRICEEIGIEHNNASNEFRIDNRTRADLVLKHKKGNRIKHIVEFKRHLHASQIKKDALRLSWICTNAPAGHRTERNYLVAITPS